MTNLDLYQTTIHSSKVILTSVLTIKTLNVQKIKKKSSANKNVLELNSCMNSPTNDNYKNRINYLKKNTTM